ncbi:MAG TPA: Uma2 family endonuclease [Tepidisphaeraceae bacterium]|nr:Uma2 family endonuclease [Tepidisphaeraceae bacterium]
MTITHDIVADPPQHIVFDDVSWDFYEHLLREVGNEAIRITYDRGGLEIRSPLPKHERLGEWIGRLLELMCLEREIPIESLGSTTFRSRTKRSGLEPDQCFYIKHAERARSMEEAFDPAVDLPPDLAVEIDITNRSIDREPIYAALRVPELWRFDGKRLQVLHLSAKAKYTRQTRSLSFPFLSLPAFEKYVLRMNDRDQIRTLRDFRKWVAGL